MLKFGTYFFYMINSLNIKKSHFSTSNILTGLFLIFVLAMLVNPDVKSGMIRGLMNVGLFQPDIPLTPLEKKQNIVKLSSPILLKDSTGKIINLSELKGKVVFLNFWATWCPPCRAEMKSLNELHQNFRNHKNIVFLTIDVDSDYKKAKKLLDRKGYSFPIFELASSIPDTLFNGSIPATLILDKAGQIVFKHEGALDFTNSKFNQFLSTLGQ